MITYSTLFFVYMGGGFSTALDFADLRSAVKDTKQLKKDLNNKGLKKTITDARFIETRPGGDVGVGWCYNCCCDTCCAKKEPPDDANGPTDPSTTPPTGYRMVRTDF